MYKITRKHKVSVRNRLFKKISHTFRQLDSTIRRKYHFVKMKRGVRVLKIDGGLGSQILKYAIYMKARELSIPVRLETSYFDKESELRPEFVKRSWSLHHFGYEYDSIAKYSKPSLLNDKDFVCLFEKPITLAFGDREFLNCLFPLPVNVEELLFQGLGVSEEMLSTSIGIHIRQGDYANVASKYYEDDFYARVLDNLLNSPNVNHNNRIVIFSDSIVNQQRFPLLFSTITKAGAEIFLFDVHDEWVSHLAMRSVGTLICTNSTFSFSAALLRDGISIFPKEFYDDDSRSLNYLFQCSAEFLIRI